MDFEILKGAPGEALKDPYKVYLTQEMATKYYGDESPIGKMVKLNNDKDLEVVGIVQTPPKNTNLPFKMIVSLPTMRLRMPDAFRDNWGMTWAYSCYALAPGKCGHPGTGKETGCRYGCLRQGSGRSGKVNHQTTTAL